jgi:hypothetical protein
MDAVPMEREGADEAGCLEYRLRSEEWNCG